MKTEDKIFLKLMVQTLEALTKRLEQTTNVPLPPVLFSCKCTDCGGDTVHVSYIARGSNSFPIAETTGVTGLWLHSPIKRCLACGLVTYEKGEDEH